MQPRGCQVKNLLTRGGIGKFLPLGIKQVFEARVPEKVKGRSKRITLLIFFPVRQADLLERGYGASLWTSTGFLMCLITFCWLRQATSNAAKKDRNTARVAVKSDREVSKDAIFAC